MLLCRNERYLVRLAESEDEVEQALRLRYRVFREELGRLSSLSGFEDRDEYDRFCRHLTVVSRSSGAVVGTYRVGIPEELPPGMELYSQREFRILGLGALRGVLLEVGRSCVAPEFRSGAAVALLWAGLAELSRRTNRYFLLGCASFGEREAALAAAFHEEERSAHRLSTELTAEPKDGFRLPSVAAQGEGARKETGPSAPPVEFRKLPPLLKGYLRLGGKICSPPAWDREFGSIDLLVGCDLKKMTEKYAHHFHLQCR